MIFYCFPASDYDYLVFCCEIDKASILDMFLDKHSKIIEDAFLCFIEEHPQLKDFIQSEDEEKTQFFYAVCFAYKTILIKELDEKYQSGADSTKTFIVALSILDKICLNPYNPEFIEQLKHVISIVLDSISEQFPL